MEASLYFVCISMYKYDSFSSGSFCMQLNVMSCYAKRNGLSWKLRAHCAAEVLPWRLAWSVLSYHGGSICVPHISRSSFISSRLKVKDLCNCLDFSEVTHRLS